MKIKKFNKFNLNESRKSFTVEVGRANWLQGISDEGVEQEESW